jgi:putative N6-adenine-specific DNA methylase
MEGLIVTHNGMEDIAALEVKELTNSSAKAGRSCIVFDIKEYKDLFTLCYRSQSAIGVYHLLGRFNFDDLFDDFSKNVGKIGFCEWLSKNTSFRVRCKKNGEEEIKTPEIEKKLGEIIIDYIEKKHNYDQKVNLDNPDVTIFFYLASKECYVGIDFAGFDLSKRHYNIFTHPSSVKGTLAYSLVRILDYKGDETMLSCFSGSGMIPIEAALFALDFPVNFFNKEKFAFLKLERFKDYNFKTFFEKIDSKIGDCKLNIYNLDDSMKYINYAKKNSKIAGVEKKITFSRMDTEWLDTKFDKEKVDKIIAILPSLQTKEVNKSYNEFFYQAEYILGKNGMIVVMGDDELIKKFSDKYKFKISRERSVFSGKKEHKVYTLIK